MAALSRSRVRWEASERVGGSGVLKLFDGGLQPTVRDVATLMVAVSDNTATNLLVNRLGTAKIDERLARYGLAQTKIFRPTFRDGKPDVFPELEKEFGLGMSTPREMAALMALSAIRQAIWIIRISSAVVVRSGP